MLTLSFGFKKPQNNDKGPVVFPAMEANVQQLNDHTHNNIDSAPISTASLSKATQSVPSGSWALVSGGHYKQTITLPGTLQFDSTTVAFRTSTGIEVHPSVKKVTATTFDVFFDDPALTLTMLIN